MCYRLEDEILVGNVTIYCEHLNCDHYSMGISGHVLDRCGKISQDLPCVNDPLHDERLKKVIDRKKLNHKGLFEPYCKDYIADNDRYQGGGKTHGMKTYG